MARSISFATSRVELRFAAESIDNSETAARREFASRLITHELSFLSLPS